MKDAVQQSGFRYYIFERRIFFSKMEIYGIFPLLALVIVPVVLFRDPDIRRPKMCIPIIRFFCNERQFVYKIGTMLNVLLFGFFT